MANGVISSFFPEDRRARSAAADGSSDMFLQKGVEGCTRSEDGSALERLHDRKFAIFV